MVTNVLEASFLRLHEEMRPFSKREMVYFAHLSMMVALSQLLLLLLLLLFKWDLTVQAGLAWDS